ncbi:hypothetical protein [Roseovarius salis]|uniref:hypothetical protein n=1 Tax=Roseovarius salis TaxID=3376063 RepID=UPI0037CB3900
MLVPGHPSALPRSLVANAPQQQDGSTPATGLSSRRYRRFAPPEAARWPKNSGKRPLTLIEVQTGAYLGNDDIVRYEDGYGRN